MLSEISIQICPPTRRACYSLSQCSLGEVLHFTEGKLFNLFLGWAIQQICAYCQILKILKYFQTFSSRIMSLVFLSLVCYLWFVTHWGGRFFFSHMHIKLICLCKIPAFPSRTAVALAVIYSVIYSWVCFCAWFCPTGLLSIVVQKTSLFNYCTIIVGHSIW